MAGRDRERKLAREHYERQQVRRQAARTRAKRRNTWVAAALATVLVVGGVGALSTALGGGDSDVESQPADRPADRPAPSPSVTPEETTTGAAAGRCEYRPASGGQVKDVGTPPAPTGRPSAYTAALDTNRGAVELALDGRAAPCTVNSFRFLASKGFFDGTGCHRLTTVEPYVLQCGDPSGSGSGGPGYEFDEENLPSPGAVTYPRGTVAMARSPQPGTNGSQFFLVYRDSTLPPDYTIFGQVSGGMAVLDKVADAGTVEQGDGPPELPVEIRDVKVTEQKA